MISYELLDHIFYPGRKVFSVEHPSRQVVGMTVTKCQCRYKLFLIAPDVTTPVSYFAIFGRGTVSNGKSFDMASQQQKIYHFSGVTNITSLAAQPIGEELLAKLTERGKKYAALAMRSHCIIVVRNIYVVDKMYSGNLVVSGTFGDYLCKADGRVMVDEYYFQKMNPNNARNRFDDWEVCEIVISNI